MHPLGAASPLFRQLPLADHGLEWVHPPLPLAHPLDHATVALHRSIDETAAGLGADGEAYRSVAVPLTSRVDDLVDGIMGPLLRLPRHPFTLARFGVAGVRSATAFSGRFTTEEAKALWAGLAAHSLARLDARLTSAVALALAVTGHGFGFPFARGGSQAIVDALAGYITAHGSSIQTSTWVSSLDELPRARVYLLDVAPGAAASLGGDRVSPRSRRRLRRWKHGPGSFKVDFALSGPVPWRDEVLAAAGTIHLGGSAVDIEASERAATRDRHTDNPFVLVSQPSIVDTTRAPDGAHVVWAYCHVPNGSTRDMTEPIVRQIERFAPGFRSRIVGHHTMAPADYEAYNPNLVGGDIAGGRFGVRQTIARPRLAADPYRIGDGIYLCSASTPPGAGVHGMCGYHAAAAASRAIEG